MVYVTEVIALIAMRVKNREKKTSKNITYCACNS